MKSRPALPQVFRCITPAVLAFAFSAHAQSTESTATQATRLQVFGMYSLTHPDIPRNTYNNNGFTLGADMDFRVRAMGRFRPGLEVRAAFAPGTYVTMNTYSIGPRVLYNLGRIQPYGDLLIGRGSINYNQPPDPNFTHDTTYPVTYGGGVDIALDRAWAIRADVQRSRWNLDSRAPTNNPYSISVGARYQFHFRNHYGPE